MSYPVIEAMPVDEKDLESAAAALRRTRCPRVSTSCTSGSAPTGTRRRSSRATPCSTIVDHLVAVTGPYQGHRRMTLTYPALARADVILWLVTGAEKRDALAKLLAGDADHPRGAGRGPPLARHGRPGGAAVTGAHRRARGVA